MADRDDELASRLQRTRLMITSLEREVRICQEGLQTSQRDGHTEARLRYARAKLDEENEVRAALIAMMAGKRGAP